MCDQITNTIKYDSSVQVSLKGKCGAIRGITSVKVLLLNREQHQTSSTYGTMLREEILMTTSFPGCPILRFVLLIQL